MAKRKLNVECQNPECKHMFTSDEIDAGEIYINIKKISVRCPDCRENQYINFKELEAAGYQK